VSSVVPYVVLDDHVNYGCRHLYILLERQVRVSEATALVVANAARSGYVCVYLIMPKAHTSKLAADFRRFQLSFTLFANRNRTVVSYTYFTGGWRLFGLQLRRAARKHIRISPEEPSTDSAVRFSVVFATLDCLETRRDRPSDLEKLVRTHR